MASAEDVIGVAQFDATVPGPLSLFTARGAGVDAGPLDDSGSIRTFLVAKIRRLEVLDEVFERPEDALLRCLAARALTPVTGYVTHERRCEL
jgi:hypothetical protein